MSSNSSIQWTDSSWNCLTGCTMVSPGCAHCYAEKMSKRLQAMARADIAAGRDPGKKRLYLDVIDDKGRWSGKVNTDEEALAIPLRWKKPRRIFVNSMSDLFHKDVPFDFIDKVFAVMALCPQHTFQVLTKRPERMAEYLATRMPNSPVNTSEWPSGAPFNGVIELPLPNVWLGTSVENQAAANARIPELLKCLAAVRFLSIEPQLGPVDLHDAFYRPRLGPTDPYKRRMSMGGVNWVIQGGESGAGARPFNIQWALDIRDECRAAGVAYFLKQLGANPHWDASPVTVPVRLKDSHGGDEAEWPVDLRVCREFPDTPTPPTLATA